MFLRCKTLSITFLSLPLLFLFAAKNSLAQIPKVQHVLIVLEENTNYAEVCGPTRTSMPFLCSLKSQGSFSANYYSPTHPSIGNYESLAWGEVTTNDDNCLPTNCGFPYTGDNIVRALEAAKKTWKGYAENLPSACYFRGNTGEYAVRHSPIPYISDVQTNCLDRYVAFADSKFGFAHDLAGGTLPSFAFITPNLCDDAHNCSLPGSSVPDSWLKSKVIQPLLNSGHLNPTTGDTVLIVTFDESGNDNTHGGGLVFWFMMGRGVKENYKSTGPHVSPDFYSHYSTLRVIAELLGASISGLGHAATAPDMAEFFSPAHTDTTLASNHNPSTLGESVTLTAHVTVVAPGTGTPAGDVIFYNGSAALDTVAVGSNGEATFATSSLPVGSHSLTASYRGDANFLESVSTAMVQEVREATTTSAAASANPTVYGPTSYF